MTTTVDIVNRALQAVGTRTTIASLSEQSNEAIQANFVLTATRDELLRMAPWNCAKNFNNLVFITSAPGTPENPFIANPFSSGFSTGFGTQGLGQSWQKGFPAPPWAYEYQYPLDCLRLLYIIPQFVTGFSGGVPITTAVTGGVPSFWNGPPSRFIISIDQFFVVTGATVVTGGTGYAVGDIITLDLPTLGAAAKLQVTSVAATVVTGVTPISVIPSETVSGSYFSAPVTPANQSSTTGSGAGATFNLTVGSSQVDQRVILTNQENAMACYVRQITDPNIMDPMFLEAWISILGARLVFQLTGDKNLANFQIHKTNEAIMEARRADGNESLTINDVTPDWIRLRGIQYPVWEFSPNVQYDWGPLFTPYG